MINDFIDFLSPIPSNCFEMVNDEYQFGNQWDIYTDTNLPQIENHKIIVIGVEEDRNSIINKGSAQSPNQIRKYLYSLYPNISKYDVADIGNIKQGNTVKDTYFALKTIGEELLKNDKTLIILGGSNDLAFAQFLMYEKLEKIINICNIDAYVDFNKNIEEKINNRNYIGKIILQEPNFLFNYAHLAYQSYFVGAHNVQFMDDLYFEYYRLGDVRGKIEETEPVIRNADVLFFDFSAIKRNDGGMVQYFSPNGISAEEACQMMWYAGMNDKLSSLGLYELNSALDQSGIATHLAAQMVWSFIEGFYNRKDDVPIKNHPDYETYQVKMHNGKYTIHFVRSHR
ncbi:MAG: formimidoylglutamase, partial [Bacteroidia bacterium]|nr:formimidoylglutamase [Bacteroidia bacterium]